MPEFLAPGVYLEETGTDPMAIPGVGTPVIDSETTHALAAAIKAIVEKANPGWTQNDDHDPGVTLVRLLAFVAEGMLFRSDGDTEPTRRAVLRAATELSAAASACATATETLRRLRFYSGRLLGAADFQLEQDYHRERLRRHNRNILGAGIVSGLEVTVDPDGEHLVIAPGYAIDRCGEELAIPAQLLVVLPQDGHEAFVTVRYWEHLCDGSGTQGDAGNAGFVEEVCLVAIVGETPLTALAIARLVRSNGRWTTDATFGAPRLGRP